MESKLSKLTPHGVGGYIWKNLKMEYLNEHKEEIEDDFVEV